VVMGHEEAKNHHVSFGKSRLARAALPFNEGRERRALTHHFGVGAGALTQRARHRHHVLRPQSLDQPVRLRKLLRQAHHLRNTRGRAYGR